MKPAEPGFYWIRESEGEEPIVARLVIHGGNGAWWETPGESSSLDYDKVIVLSRQLHPPLEKTTASDPTINQVLNQLSMLGECNITGLAASMMTSVDILAPHIERLVQLNIVYRTVDGWLTLVFVDCVHDFKGRQNCVKCGMSLGMVRDKTIPLSDFPLVEKKKEE